MARGTAIVQTLQNAVTATGNGSAFDCAGMDTVCMQITGTFVATVTFESTLDGTNYETIGGALLTDNVLASTASNTADIWRFDARGVRALRARVSAYTSGNVTVKAMGYAPE